MAMAVGRPFVVRVIVIVGSVVFMMFMIMVT